MQDKRKHPRTRQQVLITFEEPTEGDVVSIENEWPAWLNDISLSGAGIETPHRIELDSHLLVEIPLAQAEDDPPSLALKAKVQRLEELPENVGFELGVEFYSMTPMDFQQLQDFIAQHEPSQS